MRQSSSFLWVPGLLLVGCAATTPPVASPGARGTPVSTRLHYELTSIADELNYEDPCPLMQAAESSGFDECLTSFDCTYCRKRGGWWMLQGCDAQPAREALLTPASCDQQARCGVRDGAS